MKRATVLVLVLSAVLFISAPICDSMQRSCALRYLKSADALRLLIDQNELDRARSEQAYLHALWQHDEDWLNLLISHHHTRAVSLSMTKLATALENGWRGEARRELDALNEALREIAGSDIATIQNLL